MKRAQDWKLFSLPVLVLLIVGCAGRPVADGGPQIEVSQYPATGGDGGRVGTYSGSDAATLAYVAYTQPGARTAIVYLHGIESHAGWFAVAADGLQEQGFDVYCLDRRGSGLNQENRGLISGHVDAYETLLADIEAFIEPLRDRYDQVYLVGLSWGGKLALAYGLSHPQAVDGVVLITPGLRAKVDVGLLSKLKIGLLSPWYPTARVPTPIQPEMFTTTPVHLDYIRSDPLRLKSATVRFFWQSHRLDGYIDRAIPGIRLPVLLFLAGGDAIIDNEKVLQVLQQGPESYLDVVRYEDQTHSIQLDAPQRLVGDMTGWIRHHGGMP